jgi:uncharacterized protein (TIGR03435 family)
MVVEALFWFHPLVWWIGARLVTERERACDDDVVRLGSSPEAYAESILRTCEHHRESPLVCVSGVTGADLKNRIRSIITGHRSLPLTRPRQLLLGFALVVTVSLPVVVGMISAAHLFAQGPTPALPGQTAAFHVMSIKRRADDLASEGLGVRIDRIGVELRNFTVEQLIREVYRIPLYQIVGMPSWARTERFDLDAKTDGGLRPDAVGVEPTTPDGVRGILGTLLIEGFKLHVHQEIREQPLYALVMARADRSLGPQLKASDSSNCLDLGSGPRPSSPTNPICGTGYGKPDGAAYVMNMIAVTTDDIVRRLQPMLGQTVVNDTRLHGRFDVVDFRLIRPVPSAGATTPLNAAAISTLFAALQEQLGLKLEPRRGPTSVLVIDGVHRPSDNDIVTVPQVPAPAVDPQRYEVAAIKGTRSRMALSGQAGRQTSLASDGAVQSDSSNSEGVAAQVYRPGPEITNPRLLEDVKPEYTLEAKEAKIEGQVWLTAVVEADGTVGEVRVTRSLDQEHGLDEEAIKAAKRWRFSPGTKDGKPVAVKVTIELRFSLSATPATSVCGGSRIPSPSVLPPSNSGVVIYMLMLCFDDPEQKSRVAPQDYLHDIHLQPSRPSRGDWVPFDETAERVISEDSQRLREKYGPAALRIDIQDYRFSNGVLGKIVRYTIKEQPEPK